MDSQYYPKATGGSRGINEIRPTEIAYYQEPIEFDKDMMKDIQPTWDSDIDSLMWEINMTIMGDADPYDFDLYFHRLWRLFIEIAKNTSPEDSKQDSLVRWIVSFREMGVLTSPEEEEIVVATASNGQKIWVDLPYLAEDLHKSWIEHSNMAFQHRVNLASFTARLVSVGVCGNTLGVCALLLFRDTLEVPRKLAKSDLATTLDNNKVSIEELLPAVKEWMDYASFKLVNLTLKSLNEYTAEDSDFGRLVEDKSIAPCGFSLSRWDFWTRRLVQIIHCNHEQVANKAIELIRLMAIGDYKLL